MRPQDLAAFRSITDPNVCPTRKAVAFVVSQMELDNDRYRREIWLWDESGAVQLTSGHTDSRPRWSPDGERLAFLRVEADGPEHASLMLLHIGGQPELLAALPLGITEAEWAPDGDRLAVVGRDWAEGWDGLDDEERERRPVRLTRANWHFDNLPPRHDRRRHIYVVSTDGAVTQVTDGPFDELSVAWHPHGDRLAFVSARSPDRGVNPGAEVWELMLEGSGPVEKIGTGFWDAVSYAPDGGLHAVGREDSFQFPDNTYLYRRDGDGSLVNLTEPLDRTIDPLSATIAPPSPRWHADGSFDVGVEDDGRVHVYRFAADGSHELLLGGDRVITGSDPSPDGRFVAFAANSVTDPGELWIWEDGDERVVTDFNEEFRATVPLVSPEPFVFESDGATIHGWAYLPPGEEQVPLLLNIHGGPASQYGWGFFDEFQVYARAGYGVVACNPRGSSGRGREFMRAVIGEWLKGEPGDIRDFTACVQAALETFHRLDPDRLGVMGGSYGGFATLRLTSLDQRYRSAVVERAAAAYVSFFGTSDIGPWFGRMYFDASLPGDLDAYVQASPTSHMASITTPTLVLHAENDWRCPIEQAEQVFTILQVQGVPSEFVRFPGEGHEMSRSGKPRHRLERFEAIVDWHDRHLR